MLAMVNNTAVHICEHICVHVNICFHFSWAHTQEWNFLDRMVTLFINMLRNCQAFFHSSSHSAYPRSRDSNPGPLAAESMF